MYLCNDNSIEESQYVIAKIKLYSSSNDKLSDKVIGEEIVIGEKTGCWFCCEELGNVKRRANARDVKILGVIPSDKVKECKQIIEKCKSEKRRLEDDRDRTRSELPTMGSFISWNSDTFATVCPECRRDIAKIRNGASNIILKINNYLTENEKKRNALDEEMIEALKSQLINE